MLSAFVVARDLDQKEAILYGLTSRFGESAGPGLLEVAIRAGDQDTRWMAIRGMAMSSLSLPLQDSSSGWVHLNTTSEPTRPARWARFAPTRESRSSSFWRG